MATSPTLEREGNTSQQDARPKPDVPILSPYLRWPSQSSESGLRIPWLTLDSATAVTVTPNTGPEDTEVWSLLRERRHSRSQHALPAPKRYTNTAQEESELCEDCKKIDFQKVLDVSVAFLQRKYDGVLLADLGERCNDLSTAMKCPLCHLLHESRVKSRGSAPSKKYQLRIYSYMQTSETVVFTYSEQHHRAADIPCLEVVPSDTDQAFTQNDVEAVGRIYCLQEDASEDLIFNPRIIGQNANLSQVKPWLDFCALHHSTCKNLENQIIGLKLLDCEAYNVVPAPANASYVALSYVWGTTASHGDTPTVEHDGVYSHDPRITKTIRDAVVVAKALGYQYLWVDKLCIDQSNAEEKYQQINQMDSIYGFADLTIIAACGQDAHYGLPGVNGKPRTPGNHVKAGGISVFSSMHHPRQFIDSSKWASRGWTFQEACLSRRRLVFTDEQLYFECNTMNCDETVAPNLSLIHDKSGRIHTCFRPGRLYMSRGLAFLIAQPENAWGQCRQYEDMMVQYTKRTLTFEEDRPKAFAGIMSHFAKKRWFQIWGVSYGSGDRIDTEHYFVWGLLWTHPQPLNQARDNKGEQEYSIDMTLGLPDLASIPSWSWMGWRGEISFPHIKPHMMSILHDIRLETGQDSWITLHDFHSTHVETSEGVLPYHTTQPKVLLLDVDCVDSSEISFDEDGNLLLYGGRINWFISRGPLQPKDLYELFKLGKWELFFLVKDGITQYLMLVENLGGFAVRTGICSVVLGHYWRKCYKHRKWLRLM